MLQINIKKVNFLNAEALENLRMLEKACSIFDGSTPIIYWDSIKHKRSFPGNLLCYANNELAAYLGFFLFEEDAAHVIVMVHPNYRQQGIFSHLLHSAIADIKGLNIKKIIFPVQQANQHVKKCLISLNAKCIEVEHCLMRPSPALEEMNLNNSTIKKADLKDINLLSEIDALCFNSDYEVMLERYQEIVTNNDREAWLLYDNEKCIGKIHLKFENYKTIIHDVGIIPSQQNKGYGSLLLKFIINYLLEKKLPPPYLEVEASNVAALNLYKKCHFIIIETHEYWQSTLDYK